MEDPELDEALALAVQRNLEITQENNRHKEALQSQELASKEALQSRELGAIGKLLGGQNQVSLSAAALVAVTGMLAFAIYLIAMLVNPGRVEALERPLTISAGLVTTALAYLFGARSNRPR